MDAVKLNLDEKGDGGFYIMDGPEVVGEMVVNVSGNDLTVYHTEVAPQAEGKGVAKQLLAAMVDHARKHKLEVIPLCPYVHAQFKRHPGEYSDIWKIEHPNH
jgi:predicted GNAT family acetyltransferase